VTYEYDAKDRAQDDLGELCAQHGLERGRVYEHWKGGLYVITALSVAEDTLEPLVTYRSNTKGTESTRRLSVFVEELAWSAETKQHGHDGPVARFRRVQR
jgi:hypothetical protein